MARLLIIDDDRPLRVILKHSLEMRLPNFEISEVDGCVSARKILAETHFDVVVCDVYLQDGTAFDLISKWATIPFILMTGMGSEQIIVDALRAHAFDYVQKSADQSFLEALPHSIERAYRFTQLERERLMLASALANANDAIYLTDLDGTITFANVRCCATYDYPPSDLVGLSESLLWPAADRGEIEGLLQARFLKTIRTEATHQSSNGHQFPVSMSRSPVYDALHHAIGTVCVVRDLSEQKEAETRIRTLLSDQMRRGVDFMAALNHLRVGIAIVDSGGYITFSNKMLEQLTSESIRTEDALHWRNLLPLDLSAQNRLAKQLLKHPNAKQELQIEWPSGRRSFLEIEVRPHPLSPDARILFIYDCSVVQTLRQQLVGQDALERLVGRSEAIKQVIALTREMANWDSDVLVLGETGTGKELVARAIHDASPRKTGKFVAVNCAAFSGSLYNAQLFGHKRGAFTGADHDHAGVFETAHEGTVFLDEIGEMPPEIQAALLRVLENGEVVRIGETLPRQVNVRIIAATNRDLEVEVAEGRFRKDLLFRIRGASITIPPLRERTEDIPLLIARFLENVGARTGKYLREISPAAMEILLDYAWPGNVRELLHAIDYAVMRCQGEEIDVAHLPQTLRNGGAAPLALASLPAPESPSGDAFRRAVEQAGGNRKEAAKLLGMSRATFYRRIKELNL